MKINLKKFEKVLTDSGISCYNKAYPIKRNRKDGTKMIRTNHEIMEEIAIIAKSKIMQAFDYGNLTKSRQLIHFTLVEVKSELETLKKYGVISRGEFEEILDGVKTYAGEYLLRCEEEE